MKFRTVILSSGVVAATLGFLFLAGCRSKKPTIYWDAIDPVVHPNPADTQHFIKRAMLDDKSMTPEMILETDLDQDGKRSMPSGMAVDRVGQRIYWAQQYPAGIMTAGVACVPSKPEIFQDTGVQYPVDVAFDETTSRLFWAEAGTEGTDNGRICFSSTATSAPKKRIELYRNSDIRKVAGLAIVREKNEFRVYWITQSGLLQSIAVAPDGSPRDWRSDARLTPQEVHGLAYVPDQKRFYWTEWGRKRIGWVNVKEGQEVSTSEYGYILLSHDGQHSIFADLRARRLYWGFMNAGNWSIEWADLDKLLLIPKPDEEFPTNSLPINTSASGIAIVYPQ